MYKYKIYIYIYRERENVYIYISRARRAADKRLMRAANKEEGDAQQHQTERDPCGGLYFVCDNGKHRNAKRYNFGCNFLLGGETKVTPNTISFSLEEITMKCHCTNKVETPMWGPSCASGGAFSLGGAEC